MDAKVSWQEGMHFTGSAGSAFEVPLGADPEAGGGEDGFRPLQLMAISLAGCTAMDVLHPEEKAAGGQRLRSAGAGGAGRRAPQGLHARADHLPCDRFQPGRGWLCGETRNHPEPERRDPALLVFVH